jgi:hypothetical protein
MTTVKPQISKFQSVKILPSGLQRVMVALLMIERLLSESSRPYMLAYYLFLYLLPVLCIGGHHSKHIL